jgi:hypothetical protein
LLAEHGADDERDELQADLRRVEAELELEELRDEHGDEDARVGEDDRVRERGEEHGGAACHRERAEELGRRDRARVDAPEAEVAGAPAGGGAGGRGRRREEAARAGGRRGRCWRRVAWGTHVERLEAEEDVTDEEGKIEDGEEEEEPVRALVLDDEAADWCISLVRASSLGRGEPARTQRPDRGPDGDQQRPDAHLLPELVLEEHLAHARGADRHRRADADRLEDARGHERAVGVAEAAGERRRAGGERAEQVERPPAVARGERRPEERRDAKEEDLHAGKVGRLRQGDAEVWWRRVSWRGRELLWLWKGGMPYLGRSWHRPG